MQYIDIRAKDASDLPELVAIDATAFADPLTGPEFARVERSGKFVCRVAERDGRIVGYVLYRLAQDAFVIHRLAVAIDARRSGVGRALVGGVLRLLRKSGRKSVVITVPDDNLAAQLFFRACGFIATEIVDVDGQEFYRMSFGVMARC